MSLTRQRAKSRRIARHLLVVAGAKSRRHPAAPEFDAEPATHCGMNSVDLGPGVRTVVIVQPGMSHPQCYESLVSYPSADRHLA